MLGADTFEIEIGRNGLVEVHAGKALREVPHFSPYGCVEQLFVAMGERFLIEFCGILVVRDALSLRGPIVFDGVFDHLQEFQADVMRQVRKTQAQVILLETEWGVEQLANKGLLQSEDKVQHM